MDGTARYASKCGWVFQHSVATRSPRRIPSAARPLASAAARCATCSNRLAWKAPSTKLATRLPAWMRLPCARINCVDKATSIIVACMVCPFRLAQPDALRSLGEQCRHVIFEVARICIADEALAIEHVCPFDDSRQAPEREAQVVVEIVDRDAGGRRPSL